MVKLFFVFACGLVGLVQTAYGLDCKICYVDNAKAEESENSCQVLPCNNKGDYVKASVVRVKVETGRDVTEAEVKKVLDAQPNQPSKFVCTRSNNILRGSKSIVTACTADLPNFPPADHPYAVKDFMKALMPTLPDWQLDLYKGKIFVCDDKTGNGKKCGAGAELKLPPSKINLNFLRKG